MTPSTDPLVGRTVAHYDVLARLGGGGMGVVYKARDTRLGRTVALKFLPPQWSHDEDAKQRFVREAQAASATDHRNICTIHDITATDDGQLFIVMAYYEGPTLKQRLESGPLPIDEALDIATQVAEGLARAHAQGVVHRDIKPGNIILAEDGVRILDFGLATFVDALQLTVVGSTLGTAAYMSPEQVRGEAADARADVWAAGVILYQMLAGHVPFRGGYAEAIAHAIRNETPATIRSARPDVPEEVEQIVFRALHKDPSVRFPSGRELARALRQARGQTMPLDLRTQEVIAPAGAALSSRRRSRTLVWAAIAVILLATLAGAAWMLRPPYRPAVAILPISNQTGDAELAPYQRALTLAMIEALSTSPVVRPVSWTRALQDIRRFDGQLASIEAAGALVGIEGAAIVVVPTLLYEDEQWRIRIEVRDGVSQSTLERYESAPMVSALKKETAYALAYEGARLVERHFGRWNPRRWIASGNRTRLLTSLDAVRAFEEGVDLYDEQEYGRAYAAFGDAARLDPSSSLAALWQARAALLMRDRPKASAAATTAERLLSRDVPAVRRRFADAVTAEARGEADAAASAWRALIDAAPDEPAWLFELAMFEDRRGDTREQSAVAVRSYRDVLGRDGALARPHLELCRIYNDIQESPNALKEGNAALDAYRKAQWQGGEAMALLCLVDTLRAGKDAERAQAGALADQAHAILIRLGFSYNLPRAQYYQALATAEQGNLDAAVTQWQEALAAAGAAGNLPLQPIVLNNLGVANNRLGQPAVALRHFNASAALYEATGQERRAARQQYNSASLRINYSINDDAVLRDLDNALAVARRYGDNDYEIAGLTSKATFFSNVGRFSDAESDLNRALELVGKYGLEQRRASVVLQRARLHAQRSEYVKTLSTLESIENLPRRSAIEARILRGEALSRLGDFDGARSQFADARAQLDARDDTGLRPLLHCAVGELLYRVGQIPAARLEFEIAAGAWDDEFNDEPVLEAYGSLGFIEVLQQKHSGIDRLMEGIRRARVTNRTPLETRLRLLLAAAHTHLNELPDAARAIEGLPKGWETIGGDWVAQVHYWRGRLTTDPQRSQRERNLARSRLQAFIDGLPEAFRASIERRSDLRPLRP